MIDLHTHLLPGLDDGPETIEESLELAREMVADGVTIAACTPHVRDDHPTTPERMEATLAELRAALACEQIPLDVRGGGEIALDELPRLDEDARARFGLGGNPKLLLVEFPYYGWPLQLSFVVSELRSAGIVPLLAHPERNPDVQERPERLEEAVAAGARVQLTAASVDGTGGSRASNCARALLELGLAHVIASDAHGAHVRRSGMGAARKAIKGAALGKWLTVEAPRALLDGAEALRPAALPRRGWFGRR